MMILEKSSLFDKKIHSSHLHLNIGELTSSSGSVLVTTT